MKTQKNIETMLESTAPKLQPEEARVLWQRIETKIVGKAIPSPFFNMFTVGRLSMAALALILIVGAGGTTVAAQQSRPGDVLFPVERALEEVRLALAVNDTYRASLQLEFAEERLAELRSLIGENPKTNVNEIPAGASSTIRFSGEADVFSDVTIVYVEINNRKSSFRTEVKSRDEVIKEIAQRYNLTEKVVDAGLDFEIEDRTSRVSDISHDNNDERVDESIKLLSSLVDNIDDSERKRFVNEVLNTLDFDDDSRVEIRDDEDDKRIEIRDGDERVRVREKDGEIRIDIKSDDDREEGGDNEWGQDSDSDENDAGEDDELNSGTKDGEDRENDNDDPAEDEENDSDNNSEEDSNDAEDDEQSSDDDSEDEEVSSTEGVSSIEARVDEGKAEVRVSYDNDDDRFTLPYVSRTLLVSAISIKTGLSETVVEENLELEIKD